MNSRGCIDVRKDLPWLANQSLPPERRRALWEHISSCAPCRLDLIAWLRWSETVAAELPTPDPVILDRLKPDVPDTAMARAPFRPDPFRPPLTYVGRVLEWAAGRALAESGGT